MAFREEAGLNTFRPYEKMSIGETVAEGWYEGPTAGKFGTNYLVREADGTLVEVNGCGHLKFKIEKSKILLGDFIKIVYDGKDVLARGKFKGKDTHNVKLFRDPERSLHGAKAQPQQTSPAAAAPRTPPAFQEVDDEASRSQRVKDFADSLADDDGELDL